jgi:hypothetical protein
MVRNYSSLTMIPYEGTMHSNVIDIILLCVSGRDGHISAGIMVLRVKKYGI